MFEKQHQFFNLVHIILKKTLLLVVSGRERGNCYTKRELLEKADFLDQFGYSAMPSFSYCLC